MKTKLNALLIVGLIVSLCLAIGAAYSSASTVSVAAFTSFVWILTIIVVVNIDNN